MGRSELLGSGRPGPSAGCGLLGDPCAGRMAGRTQDVDAATGDLYHEEDVDALEEDGVDGEEIACENTGRLGSEERGPGGVESAGRRLDAGPVQDSPHGGDPDPVAEPEQLAVDASVPL
jgi:hypothetical protein